MLNKIDKKILGRISIQKAQDENIDVIVMAKDYAYAKNILHKYSCGKLIELPLINAIALNTNLKNIIEIASNNCVEFVSSNSKVCGLIFKSKKIMHVEIIENLINEKYNHTCVVIDTGIYPHIDFCLGKNRIAGFVDLINNKTSPYDDNGHGTFVSGILCGNSVTHKYSGIDNRCNIIVIKALDSDGETSSVKILQAMQWIINNRKKYNIKVVCMSFGSQLTGGVDPLIFGAEVLWDNGIVVVSAGGNSGPDMETIMSPGASRKIITVGSLEIVQGDEFKVADFSSRGPALGNYKPDLLVPGVDIISTNVWGEDKEFYTKMTGTSVSTPMVAGIVSLLFKINPNYSPNQIKFMLLKSCVPISGDRNAEGFGRLDLRKLKLL